PADAFARYERVVVETALRAAADIPTCAEYVEPIGLDRFAVVDRGLGLQNRLVHFEFAEIGGLVAEPLEHRTHIRHVGVEGRCKRVLRVVEGVMYLRRLTGQKGRA